MKPINVLALCDGMSGGQIALTELGVSINQYYASEIDKFAIQQTQHNFPKTIQLGDMVFLRYAITWKNDVAEKFYKSQWISEKTKRKFRGLRSIDYKYIDLVIGGTPCQGFSFAGKQLAFNDPRSKLFFDFIKILDYIKKLNPDVKFLLENVNMKKSHLEVISRYTGVFPVRINSNLVSAQNRDRWYWTNVKTKQVGLFDEIYSDIPQPKDRGILLRDILEKDVDEKYYIKNPKIGFEGMSINGKSNTLRTGGGLSQSDKHNCDIINILQLGRGFNKGGLHKNKTPTISSNSWEQNNLLVNNYRIRRLTPIECSRLQTIPDWYKWIVSDTQIYKQCGNGWTIEVIKHILSQWDLVN